MYDMVIKQVQILCFYFGQHFKILLPKFKPQICLHLSKQTHISISLNFWAAVFKNTTWELQHIIILERIFEKSYPTNMEIPYSML